MRILLLGANGQVGNELAATLPAAGLCKLCSRAEVDLTDNRSIISMLEAFKPEIIVNAAAYTAVDQAEKERETAFRVNAEAVGLLAEESAKRDVKLIHYSTDYVFDGTQQNPYLETDAPNPVNVYGASKFAGEKAIASSGCEHLIFRTTWVIGSSGKNFAATILRLAAERESLNVINDQFGVPTSPALIAKVTAEAIGSWVRNSGWPPGIYHLVPTGETTWHGIAETLLRVAEFSRLPLAASVNGLNPISSDAFPTAAKRPANSRLSTHKLKRKLSFDLPHWQADFGAVAEKLVNKLKTA